MGANQSDFENPLVFTPANTNQLNQWKAHCDAAKPKTNQLTEFHSNNQWKTHFDATKETNKLMVVYFTATWCGPCKFLEPYVNEIAAKYTDVSFIKIDVDRLEQVAREFELVDVLPTFVFVKKGKEIDRVVGAKKEQLQMKTEKHRTY